MSELDDSILGRLRRNAAWLRKTSENAAIAGLEVRVKEPAILIEDLEAAAAEIERLQPLAAAPAPTVSGEPVAWMRVRDDGRQTFWERDVDGFCVPLYTHPAPTRAEVLEAFRLLVDRDVSYHGNEIRIACASHFDAIKLVADARIALAGEKP